MKIFKSLSLLVVFLLSLPLGYAQSFDLTGLWQDNTGGGAIYRVRQIGNAVYWSVDATSLGSYANIFFGEISGNTLTGTWVDLPGSPSLSSGNLTLQIQSNDWFIKVGESNAYGAQEWIRQGTSGGTGNTGFEVESNRPGSDYLNFDLTADDPGQCFQACQADGACKAWTYVKPGVQGPSARCWLKSSVPERVDDNCCVSGTSDGNQPPPPLPAGSWVLLPGSAVDIGIGGNDGIWITGTDGAISRWNGAGWETIYGTAVQVAVDPTGAPWVVNAGGGIYRRTGDAWIQLPGAAMDIGIGANGDVWVTGTDSRIYKWDGSSWVAIDGVAVRVAVDPTGAPWVVNAGGGIYRRTGDAWIQLPGAAMDIGIGANGDVWVTGTDSRIYKWDGSSWVAIDGVAVRIAVDSGGNPWVVNASGQIYRQMR